MKEKEKKKKKPTQFLVHKNSTYRAQRSGDTKSLVQSHIASCKELDTTE